MYNTFKHSEELEESSKENIAFIQKTLQDLE